MAALISFYRGERNGEHYPLLDDEIWLTRYADLWPRVGQGLLLCELVNTVLGDAEHWGEDLTAVPGLDIQVTNYLEEILTQGMRKALTSLR